MILLRCSVVKYSVNAVFDKTSDFFRSLLVSSPTEHLLDEADPVRRNLVQEEQLVGQMKAIDDRCLILWHPFGSIYEQRFDVATDEGEMVVSQIHVRHARCPGSKHHGRIQAGSRRHVGRGGRIEQDGHSENNPRKQVSRHRILHLAGHEFFRERISSARHSVQQSRDPIEYCWKTDALVH